MQLTLALHRMPCWLFYAHCGIDVWLRLARSVDPLGPNRMVWIYNIAWMFVLGGVRLVTERFAAHRIKR